VTGQSLLEVVSQKKLKLGQGKEDIPSKLFRGGGYGGKGRERGKDFRDIGAACRPSLNVGGRVVKKSFRNVRPCQESPHSGLLWNGCHKKKGKELIGTTLITRSRGERPLEVGG